MMATHWLQPLGHRYLTFPSVSCGQILCKSEIALVQWQREEQIKAAISGSKRSQIDFYMVGLWCKKYSHNVCLYFKDKGQFFYFINSCNNGRIFICPSQLRFPGRTGGTVHMCSHKFSQITGFSLQRVLRCKLVTPWAENCSKIQMIACL